jgi:hypothetical protein
VENILEGLQKQIKRCIELKKVYDEIPQGWFGATFIQTAINEGEKALISGDVIEQIRCYKELEECS